MSDDDKYLLKPNGKPYRTKAGNRMLLDQFDGDPSYNPALYDKKESELDKELEQLGITTND